MKWPSLDFRCFLRTLLVHDASSFFGFVADAADWLDGQEGGPGGSSAGGVWRVKIARCAEVEEVTHVSILQPVSVPSGEGRDIEGLLNEGQDRGAVHRKVRDVVRLDVGRDDEEGDPSASEVEHVVPTVLRGGSGEVGIR